MLRLLFWSTRAGFARSFLRPSALLTDPPLVTLSSTAVCRWAKVHTSRVCTITIAPFDSHITHPHLDGPMVCCVLVGSQCVTSLVGTLVRCSWFGLDGACPVFPASRYLLSSSSTLCIHLTPNPNNERMDGRTTERPKTYTHKSVHAQIRTRTNPHTRTRTRAYNHPCAQPQRPPEPQSQHSVQPRPEPDAPPHAQPQT